MSGAALRTLSENEREVLAIIWRAGSIARSDVARHTRLAQQSVHRILQGLVEERLLRFGEPEIRGRGQPSPTVEIDPSYFTTVGIAINSEGVRYCLADLRGKLLLHGELEAHPSDREAVLSALEQRFDCWHSTLLQDRRLLGLGVSLQGYRTSAPTGRTDRLQPSRRLSIWRETPPLALFEARFGLPCFTENNATSSAVAEHFLGHGSNYDCFAYLSFNQGFGGGLMFQRNVFLGHHGNAGEIGTLFTDAQKPLRPALIGLMERQRAAGMRIETMRDFLRHFSPDDPVVKNWLTEITPQLQLAIRALKAVADPGAIFFGGDAPQALRQMLIEAAKTSFGSENSPNPQLLLSGIEGDAAHLGAAYLPLHRTIY